jgi:hypothetical protein
MRSKNLVVVTFIMALSASSLFAGAIDNINAANDDLASSSVSSKATYAINNINAANGISVDEFASTTKSLRARNDTTECKVLIPIIFTTSNQEQKIGGFVLGDDNADSPIDVSILLVRLSNNLRFGVPLLEEKDQPCWIMVVPDLASTAIRNILQSLYGQAVVIFGEDGK